MDERYLTIQLGTAAFLYILAVIRAVRLTVRSRGCKRKLVPQIEAVHAVHRTISLGRAIYSAQHAPLPPAHPHILQPPQHRPGPLVALLVRF